MIKIQVIGNLGSDAVTSITNNNKVINFSVAHSTKRGDREYTTWVKCAWWGDNDKVAPFLKKGMKVYVEGYPDAEGWKDNKGDAQAALTMTVMSLELLTPKEKEG